MYTFYRMGLAALLLLVVAALSRIHRWTGMDGVRTLEEG